MEGRRMRKVRIKRNVLGDTRTATKIPDFYEFSDSNKMHSEDVENMMEVIAGEMRDAGRIHDFTKRKEPHRSLFYRELCATIEGKMNFVEDGKWYRMHCETERHHLNEYCPEDVNLIDVLEMICDCVCAGMARTGDFKPVEISPEILQRAVENTAKMCADAVEIVEE